MDVKTARSAWEQNKTVDVEKLLDLVGRLENALDQANQKIEELTKKLEIMPFVPGTYQSVPYQSVPTKACLAPTEGRQENQAALR